MIYLIQVMACSAIFYLAFHFLFKEKNNHHFNRFYLISSLVLSVVIPLLQIPFYPEYVDVISQPLIKNVVINNPIVEESFSFSWFHLVLGIYFLGIIIHAFIFIKQLFQLSKIIQLGKKINENGIVKIITNNEIPVSSFLNYLFIPEEKENSISEYELRHEEIHIQQKHSYDLLFVELVKIIFWFNPIIILYRKRLVEIHEFLADQYTILDLGQESYEVFLSQQITTSNQQYIIHNFYSLFEKRIKMMNSNIKTRGWQYAIMLPIIAMSLMAFSFENYKVYNYPDEGLYPQIQQDTFPPIPPELEGKEIDTIITFNPDTWEETIEYVVHDPNPPVASPPSDPNTPLTGIDTLVLFDPLDFSETIIIMNHDTGQVDTIR